MNRLPEEEQIVLAVLNSTESFVDFDRLEELVNLEVGSNLMNWKAIVECMVEQGILKQDITGRIGRA